MRGSFEIVNEIPNGDGTFTWEIDIDDEFIEWFKEWQDLKRWSAKRFQKVLIESLRLNLDNFKLENNTMDEKEKTWTVKIEYLDPTAPDNRELCIKLPDELMEALGWEVGDEVEWEQTEIWDNHGEQSGYILKNLTRSLDETNN